MTKKHHAIDFIELPATSADALRATQSLYEEAFGWTFKQWGETYVDTQSSGVASGINADASHRPAHALVVVYSEDLEATKERLVAAGGKITKDTFAFPGGRRFHFVDPTGNELAVWSDK